MHLVLCGEQCESIAEENARCIILTAIVQHAGYKKSPSLGFILLSVFFGFTMKQCTEDSLSRVYVITCVIMCSCLL